ncbi:NAD-dependent epimerase [Mycobacterium sp. Root265]|uniref:NAD(P)-dependent oxidoreductase n=1 Tax=Mycobacterium sp. Root265 TaxID=1736504 RepID=UPI00070F3BB7|nr:NAD(P)H-binding protein [Mycobacterium sp. Root265]KRD18231.1 NAD-dependent epimerase [Mycobacterium sp. Root265]
MRIAVFGANGQTGRLLTQQVLDAGHDAVAVTRKPAGFPLSGERLRVAEADAHHPADVAAAVAGADAVISVLGVPMGLRRIDTYSVAAQNIVKAMADSGIRRLIAVSSTAVATYPGRTGAPLALKFVEPVLKTSIGRTTYADQRAMEAVVSGCGLDWTVVRPSGLFDLDHVTEYVAGKVDPVGAFTSRTDLAHYLLALAQTSGPNSRVTISTVADTPTLWQMVRREAFASA